MRVGEGRLVVSGVHLDDPLRLVSNPRLPWTDDPFGTLMFTPWKRFCLVCVYQDHDPTPVDHLGVGPKREEGNWNTDPMPGFGLSEKYTKVYTEEPGEALEVLQEHRQKPVLSHRARCRFKSLEPRAVHRTGRSLAPEDLSKEMYKRKTFFCGTVSLSLIFYKR